MVTWSEEDQWTVDQCCHGDKRLVSNFAVHLTLVLLDHFNDQHKVVSTEMIQLRLMFNSVRRWMAAVAMVTTMHQESWSSCCRSSDEAFDFLLMISVQNPEIRSAV